MKDANWVNCSECDAVFDPGSNDCGDYQCPDCEAYERSLREMNAAAEEKRLQLWGEDEI